LRTRGGALRRLLPSRAPSADAGTCTISWPGSELGAELSDAPIRTGLYFSASIATYVASFPEIRGFTSMLPPTISTEDCRPAGSLRYSSYASLTAKLGWRFLPMRCSAKAALKNSAPAAASSTMAASISISTPSSAPSVPCARRPVVFSRAASLPLHIASKLLILNRHEIIPFTASPLFSRQKQQSLNQRVQGSSPCARPPKYPIMLNALMHHSQKIPGHAV
jgi:hypothetical protein